jgi:hypothetical protein
VVAWMCGYQCGPRGCWRAQARPLGRSRAGRVSHRARAVLGKSASTRPTEGTGAGAAPAPTDALNCTYKLKSGVCARSSQEGPLAHELTEASCHGAGPVHPETGLTEVATAATDDGYTDATTSQDEAGSEEDDEAVFAAVLTAPPLPLEPLGSPASQRRRRSDLPPHSRVQQPQVVHVALETGVHHSMRSESTDGRAGRPAVTTRPPPAPGGARARPPPAGPSNAGRQGPHVPQLDLLRIANSPYAQPALRGRRRR